MTRTATTIAALVAVGALAGCSSSARTGPATATTLPGPKAATVHAAGTFHVGSTLAPYGDATRQTAANGDAPALPERKLPTLVLYPTKTGSGTTAGKGAPPDRADGPFPLVVFAHGYGASPEEYRPILAQWASAGYVVAAPAFPLSNGAAAGGASAADYVNQPADMSFVVDAILTETAQDSGPLSGLVDGNAVGVAGHSLGGITTLGLAANTCCHDARVKAAIVMSGDALTFPRGRFDYTKAPPILFVHGDADPVVAYESSVDAYNLAQGPKGLLTVLKGDHGSPVDSKGKAFDAVVRATLDFFDGYLKHDGDAVTRLAGDGVNGVTKVVFDARSRSRTTVPATPTTVGPARHAQASATTGLRAGQSVTVTWSNYTPGKAINVVECSKRDALDPAACDLKHAILLHPDPTGSGTLPFTIVTGTVGAGACDAAHDTCTLIVNDGGSFDPAASVRIPITFAAG